MSAALVTFAGLVLYEGDTGRQVVGVWRGRLRGQPGARYINSNAPSTEQVAMVERRGDLITVIRELEREYATAWAPAVDWGV